VSAPRVLVPGAALAAGAIVVLPEVEARHLRVSRVGPGGEVILLDGAGARAAASLDGSGRAAAVRELLPPRGEPRAEVTVLLGIGDLPRVEWAVEKGTECGAAAFVLVAAARSQRAHVAAAGTRLERLRRIAAEAAKQCDRTRVPAVLAPAPLAAALAGFAGRLLVARPGAPPLPREAGEKPGAVGVAIGPEGGFDAAEERLLDGAGAVPFSLGARILRLETAVVAALARLVDDGPP
jgi:16S rRNA (uracil1498-N3)-methyltransferase